MKSSPPLQKCQRSRTFSDLVRGHLLKNYGKGNEKAMNRNQGNQKANPILKTNMGNMGNNQNHKQTRYNKNKWPTEWSAISQKVVKL